MCHSSCGCSRPTAERLVDRLESAWNCGCIGPLLNVLIDMLISEPVSQSSLQAWIRFAIRRTPLYGGLRFFGTVRRRRTRIFSAAVVLPGQIFFVGNTMIDSLLANMERLRKPACWDELGLQAGKYIVLTLHRPANVDEEQNLAAMLDAIVAGARDLAVVFPVHPRTAKTLRAMPGQSSKICFVDPQPYLEFNYLVRHAKAVVTDSGGVTEETTVMGVPCMTLRNSTERPETVTVGTNEILETDPKALAANGSPPR